MSDRFPFDTNVRAAAVSLLEGYRDDAELKMTVYPGRPATIVPPHAFVDRMTSRIEQTASLFQRYPRVELVVLHGLFDSGDAVAQRDRFVDGFFDWVRDNVDAAGAGTEIYMVATEDDPTYVPDWLPADKARTYFATRIILEGFAGGA